MLIKVATDITASFKRGESNQGALTLTVRSKQAVGIIVYANLFHRFFFVFFFRIMRAVACVHPPPTPFNHGGIN